ncbi:MAG: exodeoxyribonuclease VII large subunit [Deltaproteobacteria bacterium]|nr:exodeoxyribonuclease VII large subunit [Deltaproteobacteria bacterium]
MTQPKIYTVSELNSGIKSVLEERYGFIWLSAEVSNFKAHSSGHYYFSLKDQNSQIQAVMFRGANRFLKFQMEEGLEVIVNGRVTVYEPRGNYQIVVEYLEPKGLGALQLAFEQLKKKLELEGLFDPARKQSIPLLPKKIGIVTSPTGAAIRDLIQILRRRFPNIEVLLYPVNVQGASAATEIAQAIEEMNLENDIDVMIVGRGGGSLEDLWAFNTEIVARAIAKSYIPIISAVGHEIDVTISDFVADLRAPTPSAAAEMAVPVKKELELEIEAYRNRLYQSFLWNLKDRQRQVDYLKSHLKHPQKRLEELAQRVDDLGDRLSQSLQYRFERRRLELKSFEQTLKALSPLAVLERGYSISYRRVKKGKKEQLIPIKNSQEVHLSDPIEIWFSEGRLEAQVTKKIDPN